VCVSDYDPLALTEQTQTSEATPKVARMHGTPIYIWKNGKVVAEKP
jgi:hypothetical protein